MNLWKVGENYKTGGIIMELPRGYKLEGKSLNVKPRFSEINVSLLVPQKYHHLTKEDVRYINEECIKTDELIYLTKSVDGKVYAVAYDVRESKKKFDETKFIEGVPEKFRKILRRYKEMNT